MHTYVAMLRSVNVGGNRIKMDRLRALFEQLGHRQVTTYVQSGNVIFQSSKASASALAQSIERRIEGELGLTVRAIIRSDADLATTAAKHPLLRARVDPATLHVTFLAEMPSVEAVAAVEPLPAIPDTFHIDGRQVYLHCPDGYGTTKLNNAFWERRLQVPATTRNWKTVTTLARMAAETAGTRS